MKRVAAMIAVMATAVVLLGSAEVGQVATTLFQNYQAGKPIPLPTATLPGLDERGAYEVQGLYVAKLLAAGDTVLGYKAGLTSAPAQKKFGAPGPATGMLLGSMLVKGDTVASAGFTKMMLEVEIGYRLAADVRQPVDAAGAKAAVAAVMPAVEVPDLNFATFKGLTFADIVAANVGARKVILGGEMPLGDMDLNAVTGQLIKDGKPLGAPVPGKAALGDQWEALAWCLNNLLKTGGLPKKGQVIITGSLGRMYPGAPGEYQAAYTGGLGGISFTIK